MRLQWLGTASAVFGLVALCGPVRGENWPGWRGPRGDGTSLERNVPVRWNEPIGSDADSSGETENVLWKIDVPGEGHSSPIVWEDALLLTSCLPESGERILLKYDSRTGEKLWQRTVFTGPLEARHKLNSFASGTPATDGAQIFVTFLEVGEELIDAPNVGAPRRIKPGRMVAAAYDFDGNRLWLTRPGPFVSAHGFCSSPVLYEDLVIINGDHDGDAYIVGLEKTSGEAAWRAPREHRTRSYVTPLIRTIQSRDQLVLSGSKSVVGLNPRSGEPLWSIEGPTEQFVASMVYDGERFFLAGGFPTHHVMAVEPDGRGDVTGTHVAWHVTNARCYVPSPVLVDDYLLVADDHGIGNCFDRSTGARLWRARLGRHFSASLLAVDGLAYFFADDGLTSVLRPGPEEPEIVARNRLDGDFYASPAVSRGRLYLRSATALYCIGER